MWYVYAIKSEFDSSIYVGMSQDVLQRVRRHNSGGVRSTKSHRSYRLIYKEKCHDRTRAREREKYFKNGSGKELLKNIQI